MGPTLSLLLNDHSQNNTSVPSKENSGMTLTGPYITSHVAL